MTFRTGQMGYTFRFFGGRCGCRGKRVLEAEKPHWGARNIRERLVRRLDGDVRVPAKSTKEVDDGIWLASGGKRRSTVQVIARFIAAKDPDRRFSAESTNK